MNRKELQAANRRVVSILRTLPVTGERHPIAKDGNNHDFNRAANRIGRHYCYKAELYFLPLITKVNN